MEFFFFLGLTILGVGLTSFSGALGYMTWKNGQWMKGTLNKQIEILNNQTEMLREVATGQKEIAGGQKEIARMVGEGLKYLADLIVTESRFIREEIKRV